MCTAVRTLLVQCPLLYVCFGTHFAQLLVPVIQVFNSVILGQQRNSVTLKVYQNLLCYTEAGNAQHSMELRLQKLKYFVTSRLNWIFLRHIITLLDI